MSSSDNPSQDRTSRQGRRRNSDGRQPSNIIEFVDSQDPNLRSAIQRHTAYHSAAQRREIRSRLLRRSSQARYLEWTRRSRLDTEVATSSTSSTSSLSISPAPSMPERSEQPTRASSLERQGGRNADPAAADTASETISPSSQPTLSADDTVLEFFISNFCVHYQSAETLQSCISFMQDNDTSRYLLLAYACAMRSHRSIAGGNPQDQVDAQRNFGRGTNILWNRLQEPEQASSDANIQAVLLLVAYTADFGEPNEVQLHVDALRTMTDQRGGTDAFTHNRALHYQLLAIGGSRRFHLTLDCNSDCAEPLRFPDGLQLRPGGNAG